MEYTKEMLDATSIFAIRDIAKEVGVSSPTKKNKAELVDLILKITSGEIAPPEAPRRGRPKKQTQIPSPAPVPERQPGAREERREGCKRYLQGKTAFHDDRRAEV